MISPEKLGFSQIKLSYDLAHVNDHELLGDGVRVAGVVLVHCVGHHHLDELRAAKQVLD